jgi:HEAT repeat protein
MAEPAPSDELQRYVRQLKSPDVTIRSDAAHHLGRLQDPAGVPALAEALQDADEYVRKSAVAALRRIGGPEAMTALRAALTDRSEQVVLQAVNGLRDMRDKGAVEMLIRVLTRRERSLQNASTEALARIGPDAVKPLMTAFEDRSLRRRIGNQVWKILVEMGSRAIDPLLEMLEHENQFVQLTAASVLGRVGDRKVVGPLIDLFLKDPPMQEAVVTTLGRLEERGVVEHPDAHYGDREIFLPRSVIDAFGGRPRGELVEQLRTALENPSSKVRRFALKALFTLFGEGALDQLITSLDDEDVDVKRLAVKVLGRMRDKRVIEPLVGLLLKNGGQVEDAVWNTLKVLTDLREYESLRARVARERLGGQPAVRKVRKLRDVSPDWWREQD